jgi:hypothetical protein
MLGEWYLPPGMCQVISTITEGTISFSHASIQIRHNANHPNTVRVSIWRLNLSHEITPQIRRSEPGV